MLFRFLLLPVLMAAATVAASGLGRGVGRRGMEMWRILVLGVLKQGLGCDFNIGSCPDRFLRETDPPPAGGALPGVPRSQAAAGGAASGFGRGSIRCARHGEASRRLRRWRRIWGCAGIWSSGPKGPSRHWSERRRGSGMPLDPGLHRPRAGVDRRLLQSGFGEGVLHLRAGWISKGKAGRPVELGVAVCVVEPVHRWTVAVPMIEDPSAVPRSADV